MTILKHAEPVTLRWSILHGGGLRSRGEGNGVFPCRRFKRVPERRRTLCGLEVIGRQMAGVNRAMLIVQFVEGRRINSAVPADAL